MIGIPTFGADGGKSGISTYLIALLREWAAQGLALEIFHYPDEAKLFLPEGNRFSSIPVNPFWRKPLANLLWHQAVLPWEARKRKQKVLFLPAGNRRVSFYSPCPTVATVHDLASLHLKDKYDAARTTYVTKVLPALLRRQTHLVTVSECTKRDILKYVHYPEDKISVVYSAADSKVFRPRPIEESQDYLRKTHPQIGENPYIIYIARIENPGKNHIRLIKAFDSLKSKLNFPHRLILAGSDWDRAAEVHQVHQQLEHRDQITFLGFVPYASLPHLYCGADAMVFPSLFEGFGLPLLEAMSCGIPVATSDRASMPEIAGDAALLFDPEKVESIEATLRQLVEDADLRANLRTKGLARAAEFSWKRAAKETMDVITRVGGIDT
jgi:glycosyltransferase involved in cell wall biosynthesis